MEIQTPTETDLSRKISQIYPNSDMTKESGVLHVTAVWESPSREYFTLKIKENTPKNDGDALALNLSRAKADVIITSGKILREEPELTHDFFYKKSDFIKWRSSVLNKPEPPFSLILTSGRDLEEKGESYFNHPIFNSSTRPIIYTKVLPSKGLQEIARRRKILLHEDNEADIRRAIDFAESKLEAKTISIEVGPSTSQELYKVPFLVNELMLSVYKGAFIEEDLIGLPFLSLDQINNLFGNPLSSSVPNDPQKKWKFRHYSLSSTYS